jgi:hypothetical protein
MLLRDPIGSTLREVQDNSAVVQELANVIPGIIQLNPDGTVDCSKARLDEELIKIFAEPTATQLGRSLSQYAAGGALSLDDGAFLVPWRAVEETSYLNGGTPNRLRAVLGIQDLTDPHDIARALHKTYPVLQKNVFTGRTAVLLTSPPRTLAPRRMGEKPNGPNTPIDRGGGYTGPVQPTPPDPDDYLSIARCVLAGAWGPYYDDPVFNSGWTFGFRVCIPYDCATALAIALMKWFVPGFLTLGSALRTALVQESLSAGLESLASVVSFWIGVAAFATGIEMEAANAGNGVCIHFPWPLNPIPVWSSSR